VPEHFKALVLILIATTAIFVFAKAPATAMSMTVAEFDRRRNLWYALTFTIFFAHHYWLYMAVAALLLHYAQRREPGAENKFALYCFVLLALPPIPGTISGMGLVNALFDIDYVRLLALTVLLPALFLLRRLPGTLSFGRTLPDKILASYLIVDLLQMFLHRTFTSILREGVFYAFIDVYLPYYVASRALSNVPAFRNALMSFVVAAMVISPVLFIEFSRGWLLYESLERALGAHWGWNSYVVRGGNVRAAGSIGHPIAAGYVVAIALGFYLYLQRVVSNRNLRILGFAVLFAGLLGPLSRAPWLGAVLIVMVFIATGPAPVRNFTKLGLVALVALPVVLVTPFGATLIDHLPFVGTIDARNVTGRALLAQVSYQVFWEAPLFGRHDFVLHPALQALMGEDGQVDLVNTYVIVGLGHGVVGLALFVSFFLVVMSGVYKAMRGIPDRNDESYSIGRALLAILFGILFIIATVSPVLRIPLLYWIVAGLGVGFATMQARAKGSAAAVSAGANSPPLPPRLGGVRGAIARAHGSR